MCEDHGHRPVLEPYAPLHVLKPVADDVWVVDGPEIHLSIAGLKMPFTTRMTVIRLRNGDIMLHSPVDYSRELRASIEAFGPIRFLVAPNSLHYWWVPDWKDQLPDATVFAVPGLEKRAKRLVPVDQVLEHKASPWPDDLDVLVVSGSVLTEAVFHHRASRTLILTDLIENFEPKRIHSRFLRLLVHVAGPADPDGKAPLDMQLSFFRSYQALRRAVRQMIIWAPERIIIAHGRWYRQNAVKELRRSFRWVL